MSVPQAFFEFGDIRPFQGGAWIPLRRSTERALETPSDEIVRIKEYLGIATTAVEHDKREAVAKLGWTDLGISSHRSIVERWGYAPSDLFHSSRHVLGVNLVIDQYLEEEGRHVWHLHPDLVVALGLAREADSWFRPEEGWIEVVRMKRDETGQPALLDIRSEFLGDYLSARNMALFCSSYHDRVMVSVRPPDYVTPAKPNDTELRDRREFLIAKAKWPDSPDHTRTIGALWRTEWVEPAPLSVRVRGDRDPHESTFALENDGGRVGTDKLEGAGTWLYFHPALVSTLLRYRGASLQWTSEETCTLGATAFGVPAGINALGLITAYAKDIGRLQAWEQRLWSAHNLTPEGGVSRELFAAQMEVRPAATVAPEAELAGTIDACNSAFLRRHGTPLLRDHDDVPAIMQRVQRFRAADPEGLTGLAKDVTRLFIERVDTSAVIVAAALPKTERKPGSLKAIETLIGQGCGHEAARAIMAPLFGIYDLRLADAHLSSSNAVADALARIGVVLDEPAPMQGRRLLRGFVEALRQVTNCMLKE